MSNFNENNFDNIFKDKLGGYEEAPPDFVFNNLKAHFSNRPTSISNKILNNKRIFIASTAIILSIIGVSIYYSCYNNNNILQSNPIAKILSCTRINNNVSSVNNNSNNNISVISSSKKDISTNNKINISENNINNTPNSSIQSDTNNTKVQLILSDNNKNQNLSKDTFKVNLNDSKPFEVSFSVIPSSCNNNNGSITANVKSGGDELTYNWVSYENNKTNKLNNLYTGEYQLKISSKNYSDKVYNIYVPDSGSVKAAFVHAELEQTVTIPIYFTNKSRLNNYSNNTSNTITYEWNFGDGNSSTETNPQHIYNKEGNYTVTLIAKSSFGCYDTMSISDISINSFNVEAPNIFTPNGDGMSDFFTPKVKPSISFKCTIFSKEGNVLIEWSDPNFAWDGKINNNPVPDGNYFYIINGIDKDNKKYTLRGNVMVVRK